MKSKRIGMIAEIIKSRREVLGYTQQEVAELAKISLRSIQRIEKGDVMPRPHTLKMLSEQLDFSLDSLQVEKEEKDLIQSTQTSKKILQVGFVFFISIIFWAYLAQSKFSPETNFETLLFIAGTVLYITLFLFYIFKKNK